MGLHRADREHQAARDFLVAEAGAEEAQHLGLARGQPEAVGRLGGSGDRLGLELDAGDQLRGALGEGQHGVAEVARGGGTRHEGVGPGPEQRVEVGRIQRLERNQRLQCRQARLQVGEVAEAVLDPRLVEEDQRDGVGRVDPIEVGLADRVERRHVLQRRAECGIQLLGLVEHQDVNGHTHPAHPIFSRHGTIPPGSEKVFQDSFQTNPGVFGLRLVSKSNTARGLYLTRVSHRHSAINLNARGSLRKSSAIASESAAVRRLARQTRQPRSARSSGVEPEAGVSRRARARCRSRPRRRGRARWSSPRRGRCRRAW